MTGQYEKAVAEVTETFNFYMSMLAERKAEVVKELEKLYSSKQVSLSVFGQKVHDSTDKMEQLVAFIDKLVQTAGTKEVLLFQSSLETKMANLLGGLPALDLASTVQLEFISNFQAIQVGVRNQFGYIKSGSADNSTSPKQPPIARPSPATSLQPISQAAQSSVFSQFSNSVMSGLTASVSPSSTNQLQLPSYDFQNNFMSSVFPPTSQAADQTSPMELLENLSVLPLLPPASSSGSELLTSLTNSVSHCAFPTVSLATPVPSAPIAYPPKAQIRRQKMIYHCKFGEFGILEGQFTEPSGVAVTEDNEIIVADTNNHRIQVFDKDGYVADKYSEDCIDFLTSFKYSGISSSSSERSGRETVSCSTPTEWRWSSRLETSSSLRGLQLIRQTKIKPPRVFNHNFLVGPDFHQVWSVHQEVWSRHSPASTWR